MSIETFERSEAIRSRESIEVVTITTVRSDSLESGPKGSPSIYFRIFGVRPLTSGR